MKHDNGKYTIYERLYSMIIMCKEFVQIDENTRKYDYCYMFYHKNEMPEVPE